MANRTHPKTLLAMSMSLLMMASATAAGRTFYVDDDGPADFTNIQAAIDAAIDGDTVIVAEGTYFEDIDFNGKNIVLRSTDPTNSDIVNSTTIDGVVCFRGTEDPTCTLSGFNIDGYIVGFDYHYGLDHTHATISHCLFVHNVTPCDPAIFACDGTISNCIISRIYTICTMIVPEIKGCHGLIKNCTMSNIRGGIDILDGGSCTIENCIIYHRAEVSVLSGATLNISYCDLQGGLAGISGDGIVNWGPGNIDTDPCFIQLGYRDVNRVWVEGDYHLRPNSPCINAGDPNYIAEPNETDLDGNPRIIGGRIDMGAYEYQPRILYVDDDATGANDGSSWADAFIYLQDALSVAYSGDEIRVAEGTYKPDQGAGITPCDREATFQLVNGVTLKGGYAGFGESDPNARDIELYETTLSGDLAGNDVDVNDPCDLWHEASRTENSYHVATSSEMDAWAVLDSFALTGGYRGGMYNDEGNPTLIKCTFSRNVAVRGGGMYNEGGSPTLINCTFSRNFGLRGGGMYNEFGSPTLSNCTFTGNWGGAGGGMANYSGSEPVLTNCTFIGNSSGGGGGMYNRESYPTLSGCSFIGNWASFGGGGIYSDRSSPIIANCTISENIVAASFGHGGGGLAYFRGSPTITNSVISGNRSSWIGGGICYLIGAGVPSEGISITGCIISGNKAEQDGGGIFCSSYITKIANCTFSGNVAQWGGGMANGSWHTTLTNCILWDNGPTGIFPDFGVSTIVTYSDVQGGWLGEGNIDVDPGFVSLGYWADINDPNVVVEPNDPNAVWVEGDYHLLPGSPCIDAGDPNHIAEPNETDLDGRPRVIAGRIDMGAYEYSPPIFAEVRIVPRTINLQSEGKWITCVIWLGDDYDVADIDPNSVFLEDEIQAASVSVDKQQQVAIVRFRRSEVQGILDVGPLELTISGQLTDGAVFEGTDLIKVLNNKGGRKLDN
ncbi:MAG: choice-of-anchor Q domain-containing protein [Planctomycetota bacterium]